MKIQKLQAIVLLVSIVTISILSGKSNAQGMIGPATIIYKTRKDYNHLVPVTLNEDKSKIVSYPSPKDVYYKGALAFPTELKKGYLLDNRGVSKNFAFLSLTYEEYSKLPEVPPLSELYSKIVDKEPFTEY